MEVFILIVLVVQGCISGFFCAYIAKEKGRGASDWFILGFFFSLLAVLALIALPKLESGRPADPNSFDSSSPAATPVDRASANQGKQRSSLIPAVAASQHPPHLFNGIPELSSDEYKIWLVEHYGIAKNEVLDSYVLDKKLYKSIEEALVAADTTYRAAEQAHRDEEEERTRKQERQRREEEERFRLSSTVVSEGEVMKRRWRGYADGTYEITLLSGAKRRFASVKDIENYLSS